MPELSPALEVFFKALNSVLVAHQYDKNKGTVNVEGPLSLGPSISQLPDTMTVQGDLYLNATNLARLPHNLTVTGDLSMQGLRITVLPEGLTVFGALRANRSFLKSMPPGFRTGGDLSLAACSIAMLPEGLDVGGDLDLRFTPIQRLPTSLRVVGSIIPPDSLLDLDAFMQAHDAPEVHLSLSGSHHDRLATRAALEAYPDLKRVVLQMPEGAVLRIASNPRGGSIATIV